MSQGRGGGSGSAGTASRAAKCSTSTGITVHNSVRGVQSIAMRGPGGACPGGTHFAGGTGGGTATLDAHDVTALRPMVPLVCGAVLRGLLPWPGTNTTAQISRCAPRCAHTGDWQLESARVFRTTYAFLMSTGFRKDFYIGNALTNMHPEK